MSSAACESEIVLASESPRRRALLTMLGVALEVIPAHLDEDALADGLEPVEAVQRVARAKALAVDGGERPVLAADTVVTLGATALGKPKDRQVAREMLEALSGQTVQVVSCVALKTADGSIDDRLAVSTLSVATLDAASIDNYLDTGEADDKAGALAVQGTAGAFVTLVEGSRSNVVGLPLAETVELLRNAGIVVEDRPGRPL